MQANLVLHGDGNLRAVRRENEVDQAFESRVLVDQVAQFVADHEAQLIFAHQVEHRGIDIDNVWLPFIFSGNAEGIQITVAGDVEIDFLLDIQSFDYILTKGMEGR